MPLELTFNIREEVPSKAQFPAIETIEWLKQRARKSFCQNGEIHP